MDVEQGGVISPGGIGFDINCGMRPVTTNLTYSVDYNIGIPVMCSTFQPARLQ
jgi:RNA-splicing ligase RtcB